MGVWGEGRQGTHLLPSHTLSPTCYLFHTTSQLLTDVFTTLLHRLPTTRRVGYNIAYTVIKVLSFVAYTALIIRDVCVYVCVCDMRQKAETSE